MAMISASLMCADYLNLGRDLDRLAGAGVEYLHIDVMDGHFVPNITLSPDYARAVKRASSIPLDVHLMVERPENTIPLLDVGEGDIVTIHFEATPHVQRALAMVCEKGAVPALALNPATPAECIREVLPDIGMVLVMTVNPGYAGQRLIPQCIDKIARVRGLLDAHGYGKTLIQVDGNCSFQNAPLMVGAGADILVAGSSSVFDPSLGVAEGVRMLREAMVLQ